MRQCQAAGLKDGIKPNPQNKHCYIPYYYAILILLCRNALGGEESVSAVTGKQACYRRHKSIRNI